MVSETQYTQRLVKEWRGLGAEVLNKLGNAWEGTGWPDLLVGSWHYSGWVEVKNEKDNWKRQETRIKGLVRNRIPVFGLRVPSMKLYWFVLEEGILVPELVGVLEKGVNGLIFMGQFERETRG
jgi:hypothetical protein